MARKNYTMILDSNYNGHVAAFMYDRDDFRLTSTEAPWLERRERDLTVIGDVATYDRKDGLAVLTDGSIYAVCSDRSAKPVTEAEADAIRAERQRERDARDAARAAYAASMAR